VLLTDNASSHRSRAVVVRLSCGCRAVTDYIKERRWGVLSQDPYIALINSLQTMMAFAELNSYSVSFISRSINAAVV